jgi:hypothetical protein
MVTRRGRDAEPLDGREHADGRCDHAVAEQQPRTEHQRPQYERDAAAPLGVQQPVEREHAAFAVILGTQNEYRVLDGDDDGERPHHQGNAPEHAVGCQGHAAAAEENLVECVQRRGADVAVNDPGRGDGQCREAAARRVWRRTGAMHDWRCLPAVG